MKMVPVRSRLVGIVLTACIVVTVLGLSSTPASALNPNSYNIFRNEQPNRLCVDMKTEDPLWGGRAQLWPCRSGPAVSEQLFILIPVADQFGNVIPQMWMIKNKRSGMCLDASDPGEVRQYPCTFGPFDVWFHWKEVPETHAAVGQLFGTCLTAAGDSRGVRLRLDPCDGNAAQRWIF
jgi:hypothetical protein